jgi:hypothetical protein
MLGNKKINDPSEYLCNHHGLFGEELHNFLSFALGAGWEHVAIKDTPTRWNQLHGDVLLLDSDSDMCAGIDAMVRVWRGGCD